MIGLDPPGCGDRSRREIDFLKTEMLSGVSVGECLVAKVKRQQK